MACPKTRVVYPSTATSRSEPFQTVVRRVDPDFDKDHRFDVAYRFGPRIFKVDSVLDGAYATPAALANDPHLVRAQQDGPQTGGSFSAGLSTGFEGGDGMVAYLAALDAQFRADNGFCDPIDNGTVQTGTGAGGANPGAVPSLAALVTPDGLVIETPDGFGLDDGQAVGVVIGPTS